jgi:TatA/E family protein of Tat protein translocase
MGNFGSTEILVVLVLALVLLGPKRLPEIGESLGRTMRRFRKASQQLRNELDITRDLDDHDRR